MRSSLRVRLGHEDALAPGGGRRDRSTRVEECGFVGGGMADGAHFRVRQEGPKLGIWLAFHAAQGRRIQARVVGVTARRRLTPFSPLQDELQKLRVSETSASGM